MKHLYLFFLVLIFSLTNAKAQETFWTDYVTTVVPVGNTYSISTPGELAWIAVQVNGGNQFVGKTIQLTADIDLSGHSWVPIAPILSSDNNFQGVFDGQTHTIDHLVINQNPGDERYQNSGLFGYVKNATIKNLTIGANVKIKGGVETGPCHTGGIIGHSHESVQIINCINKGEIIGADNGNFGSYTGGIIGLAESNTSSLIQDCVNHGLVQGVTGSYAYEGGIIGSVESDEDESESQIQVVGCTNNGVVKGSISEQSLVGGIAGQSIYASIINCQNTGDITGGNGSDYCVVGGIAGGYLDDSKNTKIENCTNTGTIQAGAGTDEPITGGIVGVVSGAVNILKCKNQGSVEGSAGPVGESFTGGIVGYAGEFEDNNGLSICTVIIRECSNENNVTGCSGSTPFTGGIVGIFADPGTIQIEYCYNSGTIQGGASNDETYTAGIIAFNHDDVELTIDNCYNSGTIRGGDASSIAFNGGISGQSPHAKIQNCHNYGAVYNAAGSNSTGGISGSVDSVSEIISCYWRDNSATGANAGNATTIVGSGTPASITNSSVLTTALFTNYTNFINWDFANTWAYSIDTNYEYPVFTGEIITFVGPLIPQSSPYTGSPIPYTQPVATNPAGKPVVIKYFESTTSSPLASPPINLGTYIVRAYLPGISLDSLETTLTIFKNCDYTVITRQPEGGSICKGSNFVFRVNAEGTNLRYQWYKGNNPIAGGTADTLLISKALNSDYEMYKVEVKGDCGTSTSESVRLWVVEPLPETLTFSKYPNPANVGKFYTIQLSGYADVTRYDWSYSDASAWFSPASSTVNHTEVKFNTPGQGVLSVALTHVCGNRRATQAISVTYPTGMDDVETGKLRIYPNPVIENLTIDNGESTIKEVTISDLSGKTIFRLPVSEQQMLVNIDASDWSKGIYLVRVTTKTGVQTQKIIKK